MLPRAEVLEEGFGGGLGIEDVGGGEAVGAARRQAEPAQGPVEGEVRAAEGGVEHGGP